MTYTEWIFEDMHGTWNFPASQASFCVEAQGGYFEHLL